VTRSMPLPARTEPPRSPRSCWRPTPSACGGTMTAASAAMCRKERGLGFPRRRWPSWRACNHDWFLAVATSATWRLRLIRTTWPSCGTWAIALWIWWNGRGRGLTRRPNAGSSSGTITVGGRRRLLGRWRGRGLERLPCHPRSAISLSSPPSAKAGAASWT